MRLPSAALLALALAPLPFVVACDKAKESAPATATPAPAATHAKGPASPGDLPDDASKTIYALGLDVGQNLMIFQLTEIERGYLFQGLKDALSGAEARVELQEWGPKIAGLVQSRQKEAAVKAREASAPALEKLAKEKGAKKTASGMIFLEETAGTGTSPQSGDKVKVEYKGTLADGTVFDESKAPVEFTVGSVVPCWNEALGLMKPGASAKLGCPAEVAYGDRGAPPKIPGGAALFFQVKLLAVTPGTGAEAMGGMGGMGQLDPRMLQQLQQQMAQQNMQGAKGGAPVPPPNASGKGH